MITSLQLWWLQNEISVEFQLRWKIVREMGLGLCLKCIIGWCLLRRAVFIPFKICPTFLFLLVVFTRIVDWWAPYIRPDCSRNFHGIPALLRATQIHMAYWSYMWYFYMSELNVWSWRVCSKVIVQGAVSIRKTVLPGMAIPMLKIRRPNGRLIFNMEIAIRR